MKSDKSPAIDLQSFSLKSIRLFWKKVDRKGPDECWNWNASLSDGYGRMFIRPRSVFAHRLSFAIANGGLSENACVLHACDNRACCNPNHLFIGSRLDNVADMVAKDRQFKKIPQASYEQIRELFRVGWKQSAIANLFGIHQSEVSRAVNFKRRFSKIISQ
jgi:predicted XRE-type DNA-binding protein